jgi:hypothetical protein
MTGYIKTYGYENTYATMWVRVDDYDKRVTADFDNMMDRPIMSTKPWTQCVIVFDVPESQCTINYGLLLLGNGKAWIDKVSFDTVSISTFKTAYYLDEPLGEVQLPQNIPESPINLDFEE